MPAPIVLEALDIAREHAKYMRYRKHCDALNHTMEAIGRPELVSFGWSDSPIKIAAIAAEWMLLPKGRIR